jgi:hypothetical protein
MLHRAFTFFAVLLLLSSCDFSNVSDALDDFNLVIEPEPIDFFATIHFFDAKTEALITSLITITIGDEASGKVIDILSDPIDSETVDNGVFSFGYDGIVSKGSPVEIPLTITSNQFETLEFSVVLSDSSTFVDVSLIDPNNPPSFYKKGTETLTLSNDGVLLDSVNIPLDEDGTFFEVGAGFSVTDENGLIITGTPQIDVSLHNFTVYEESFNDKKPEEILLVEEEALVPLSRIDINISGGTPKERQFKKSSIPTERPTYRIRHKFVTWTGGGQKDIVDIENYRFMYQTKSGLLKTLVNKTVRGYEFIESENVHFMTFDFEIPEDAKDAHAIWIMRKSPSQCFVSDLKIIPENVKGHLNLFKFNSRKFVNNYYYTENGFVGPYMNRTYPYGTIVRSRMGVEPGQYQFLTQKSRSHSTIFDPCNSSTPIEFPGLFDDIEARVELTCKNPNEKLRISNIPTASMSYKVADGNPDSREGWVRTVITLHYNSSTMALVYATFPIFNIDLLQRPTYYFKLNVGGDVVDKTVTIDSGDFAYKETVDVEFCR